MAGVRMYFLYLYVWLDGCVFVLCVYFGVCFSELINSEKQIRANFLLPPFLQPQCQAELLEVHTYLQSGILFIGLKNIKNTSVI
mgnify:CR=1 FL=1